MCVPRAASHSLFDSKTDVGLRVVRSGSPVSASVNCVHRTHARSAAAVAAEASKKSAAITEARRSRIIAGPRGVASLDGFAGFRKRDGFFEAPVEVVLGQPDDECGILPTPHHDGDGRLVGRHGRDPHSREGPPAPEPHG